MDRKLSPEIIKKRKWQTVIKIAMIVGVGMLVFIILARTLRSSLSLDDVLVSKVDRGSVRISIAASGKVTPLSEEIITSPLSSKIVDVYKKAGDSVRMGEAIIKLDLEAFQTDIQRQEDELKMKQFKLEQQKRNMESTVSDLKMQIEIDEMRIQRMDVLLRNEKFLDSIGAGTSDKIKQAELELTVEALRLEQLKLKYENLKHTAEIDTKVLELDYNIALKNAGLKIKTMSEAQVRSPKTAVISWVNDQIGSQVSQGSQLAVISDLSHFKVEAEVSDSYGNKVMSGNKAIVRVGEKQLPGTVGNVIPSVKNGTITFTVLLDNDNSDLLRPGLKVDVHVINALNEDVLRIENKSYYIGEGEYELWVIKGEEARKRKVTLGESGYDYVEAIDGLKENEEVIVSDMTKYNHLQKINIRK